MQQNFACSFSTIPHYSPATATGTMIGIRLHLHLFIMVGWEHERIVEVSTLRGQFKTCVARARSALRACAVGSVTRSV